MDIFKIGENFDFLHSYNCIVEDYIKTSNINPIDIICLLEDFNKIQLNLITYYLKIGLYSNVIIILKNIAYKKRKEIENFYKKDIKI